MMTIRSGSENPSFLPANAVAPSTTARMPQQTATTAATSSTVTVLQMCSFIDSLNAENTTSRIDPRSTSLVGSAYFFSSR